MARIPPAIPMIIETRNMDDSAEKALGAGSMPASLPLAVKTRHDGDV